MLLHVLAEAVALPLAGPPSRDGLRRKLTVATPDDPGLLHLSVVGDTYTVGDRVPGRTSPPPRLDQAARGARIAKAMELASRYRSELLPPAAGHPDRYPPPRAELKTKKVSRALP